MDWKKTRDLEMSTATTFLRSDTYPQFVNYNTGGSNAKHSQSLSSTKIKETSLDHVEFFRKESLFSTEDDVSETDSFQLNSMRDSLNDNVFEDTGTQHDIQQMQFSSKSINGIPQTVRLNRNRDDHTGEHFKMSEGNKEQHSMATEHEFSFNVEKKSDIHGDTQDSEFDNKAEQLDGQDYKRKDFKKGILQEKPYRVKSTNQSSLKYKHKTFCICRDEEGACQTDDLCQELDPAPYFSIRKSRIYFWLTEDYYEDSGMNLYTTHDGHFIEIADLNSKYFSRLSLINMDNILGLDHLAVRPYQHDIVLQMLRYLLRRKKHETVTLTIERKCASGGVDIAEINVITEVITRGSPNIHITSRTAHLPRYKLYIKGVRPANLGRGFGAPRCISNGNYYLTAKTRDKISLQTLRSKENTQNLFKCYHFSCKCFSEDLTERPKPIFIGVFKSCHTNTFLMAAGGNNLTLLSSDDLQVNMKEIRTADPRFFIVRKGPHGNSSFESLMYPSMYWIVRGNELQLFKGTKQDTQTRDDLQFQFKPFV